MNALEVVERLVGIDRPPPYFKVGDEEIEQSARYPWNAWDTAQRTGRHHPKLWQTIKGSPFERDYRARFNPID
jgi:hypothetical protein